MALHAGAALRWLGSGLGRAQRQTILAAPPPAVARALVRLRRPGELMDRL
jgi:hypothetical protein